MCVRLFSLSINFYTTHQHKPGCLLFNDTFFYHYKEKRPGKYESNKNWLRKLHFPPYRIRDKTVENKSGLDPNFIYMSINFNNYCCQMLSLLSYQAYCFARNIGILFYSILSTKVEKCDFHWHGTKVGMVQKGVIQKPKSLYLLISKH